MERQLTMPQMIPSLFSFPQLKLQLDEVGDWLWSREKSYTTGLGEAKALLNFWRGMQKDLRYLITCERNLECIGFTPEAARETK